MHRYCLEWEHILGALIDVRIDVWFDMRIDALVVNVYGVRPGPAGSDTKTRDYTLSFNLSYKGK